VITRRAFLESPLVWTAGRLVAGAAEAENDRFTPIELEPYATNGLTATELRARGWYGADRETLRTLAGGRRQLAGVPFVMPEPDAARRALLIGGSRRRIEIPIGKACHYICLAHFCDRHPDDTEGPFGAENLRSEFEPVGQRLATYTLLFPDGRRHTQPIRRRYEINPPGLDPSHVPASALPAFEPPFLGLDAPLASSLDWAYAQSSVSREAPRGPVIWVYALPSPEPGAIVRALELEAAGPDLLAICGVTLFHRAGHPLRRLPLRRFEIAVPETGADWRTRWHVGVDLGIVARVYPATDFDASGWLKDPYRGLGEEPEQVSEKSRLIAEVAAAPDAVLTLEDRSAKRIFSYALGGVPQNEVRVLEPPPASVQCRIVERGSGRPCAARVSFRTAAGRYIAPYGHPEEINTGWMQNIGPDVKIGGANYAYVDGACQIELPPGDVFVELSKGFEYAPSRQKIMIAPGQTSLQLELERVLHRDREGWVTADTHVHIGSPELLVLEGAAEGLNLVNLLAAQWGRHFTNFADRPGLYPGSTPETSVWVGSENRNHFLGHIGLLGLRERVLPFSDAGPPVAYFGSPLTTSLADWADACREQGGVTVGVHFPIPNGETVADVVLGKLDAAEIRYDRGFASLGVTEYYRYLNCGFRLAAVGGTDKMFPTRAVGAVRTYARLEPGEPFSFPAWAKAVRAGRTFVSSGPLLFLTVEGREPGSVIELRSRARVEVQASAESVFPPGEIEIVHNGRVVASGESPVRAQVEVPGPGWIAARCSSKKRLSYGMRNIGAHTSPVYLTEAGKGCFSKPAAEYMLKLIEGAVLWIDTLATASSRVQMDRVRSLFVEARGTLESRLHDHGHVHIPGKNL
jgi:hypothetical protein